jgi:hydroxymethylglutaryl-CoA lyase
MPNDIDVLVSEVGPRDGLQSLPRFVPTLIKHRWISALVSSGLREIEVTSFVPATLLPQLADADEVVRQAATIPGLTVVALVPNRVGAEHAFAAGAHKITMPVSASRKHSMANLRKSPEQAIKEVAASCVLRDSFAAEGRPQVKVAVATAFGCAEEGVVSEDWVMEIASAVVRAGADSVVLADSTGYGNPTQVKRMFTRLRREIGEKADGAHFHDTFGLGLANVVAALEAGIKSFDSSLGGLGGCPYIPGATGNIVTEDLVYLLESIGLRTGIDLSKLAEARGILLEGLPGESLGGHIARAGLPKGFTLASKRHSA